MSQEQVIDMLQRVQARPCMQHDYRHAYGVGVNEVRNDRLEPIRYDRFVCSRCLDVQDREMPLLFGYMGIFEGDRPL